MVLAFCLVLALALAGCSGGEADNGGGSEGAPASAESDDPATSDESADAAGSGSGGWLDGIPGSVPRFAYGEFDTDDSSALQAGEQTMYSMYYEGVAQEDVETYITELETAGFEVTRDSVTDGVSAIASLKEGDAIIVGMSVSWQANGHVDLTVNAFPGSE
jgi:hypothetical protein